MADTVREQIIAAAIVALGGIAGVTVQRNPDVEITKFPTIAVYDGGQTPNHETGLGIVQYLMSINLELFLTATTPALLGPALNALYGEIAQVFTSDPTLGGLAQDILEGDMEGPIVGDRQGQGPTIAASLDYDVMYITPFGDPFTVGG